VLISLSMKTELLHILTAIHFMSIAGLAIYGLHRVWLLICWLREQRRERGSITAHNGKGWENGLPAGMENFPLVTVQVPLYNEPLVAARIIDAVAAFHWPTDRLEIQILDDSSDETGKIVRDRVKYWSERGIKIYGIFRERRAGYKAGALQNGLNHSKGEFIAIFDADFIPAPDFLEKTVPHFYSETIEDKIAANRAVEDKISGDKTAENRAVEDKISGDKEPGNKAVNIKSKAIGMVQTRWGFLNSGYSWLTKLQTLMLSPHFGIEHKIRSSRHLFFNFNGTAGIWRKEAIESAGGWHDDTVTEDLDLSYRAQLAGWHFIYLNDVVVPSELPVTLADFRSQQERWSRGSIQTARKILPRLMASSFPLSIKVEAIAHLMANFCWLLGFIVTMTLYPVILYRIGIGMYQVLWIDIPLFCISAGAILTYYLVYTIITGQLCTLLVLPLLPVISIGLAPSFALSVIRGAFQKGGVFRRTPKFGFSDNLAVDALPGSTSKCSESSERWHLSSHHGVNDLLLNIPLLLYSLVPVIFTWQRETWPAIPFLSLFPLGFFLVVCSDFLVVCGRLISIDFITIQRWK